MATIVIQRPGRPDEVVALPAGDAPLGRHPECAVRVDDWAVSRQHAVVSQEPDAGKHRVRDAGSRNGTWLNGKRVGEDGADLRNGDRIQLGRGNVVLHFFEDDATVSHGVATLSGPAGFQLAGWDSAWVSGRWNRLMRAAPWLRLLGTVLGLVATALAITFWTIRLSSA